MPYPSGAKLSSNKNPTARLAQSVERKALNLVVVGSSPTVGDINFYVTPLKLWRKTTSLGNRHVQNSV